MSLKPAQFISSTPTGTEDQKGWANRRGYGMVTLGSLDQSVIGKKSVVYNRLQPLTTPFGNAEPPCKGSLCYPSSESNLAWICGVQQNSPKNVFN